MFSLSWLTKPKKWLTELALLVLALTVTEWVVLVQKVVVVYSQIS